MYDTGPGYDNGLKSGAHKVMTVFFILFAIGVIVAFGKIILDHVDSDGTVTSSKDACVNPEGMSTLKKAGVFGSSQPRCDESGDSKPSK